MRTKDVLRKVFQAIDQLNEEDKWWFMGYFGIEHNLKKFDEKVRRFLEAE